MKRRRSRGQSLAEFALMLPVLLALVGATIDFSRLYSGWIGIHAAVRNAAEYLATNPDQSVTTANAGTKAAAAVNNELTNLGTFTGVSSISCSGPEVQATYTSSPTAVGASSKYPLGTATVVACLPFRTLFNYPFITQDGAWPIRVTSTYQVLQNR